MGGGQGCPGDWELLDQGGDHGVQDGGRQGEISRGWGEGGGRYDVWVEARDPLGTGNYWIRAETMEYRTAADKVGYPGGGGGRGGEV